MTARLTILAAALAITLTPTASSAAVLGFLGNFDVIDDTGKTAHGFEIDLEGVHSSDITDTFGGPGRAFPPTVERYRSPTIQDTATGVTVTYTATFTGGSWSAGTPDISTKPTFTTGGDSCWTGGGLGYGPSTPCDHFGVGTRVTPTKTTYSWLTETNTPGVLSNGVVNLPAPVFVVTPPPPPPPGQPPAQPVVIAQIVAPPVVPEVNPLWGTPIWAKAVTTTTELQGPVALEDLVGGNPKVPKPQSETEIEWHLLQLDPGNPGAAANELDLGQPPLGNKTESVVRRIEFFKYTGAVSGEGEALPVNGDSATPVAGDLGTFIGDQNVGLNLVAPAVPEPGTYALLLAGLGVMGLVARRRKALMRNSEIRL